MAADLARCLHGARPRSASREDCFCGKNHFRTDHCPPRDPDEQIALEDGLRALRTLARMKPDKCRSRQAISFFDDFPSSSAKRGLLFERQRGDAVRQMPAYQA